MTLPSLLSNLSFAFFLLCNLSSFFLNLHHCPLFSLYFPFLTIFLSLFTLCPVPFHYVTLPTHSVTSPPPPSPSIIRHPLACSGRVPGARVGTPWWCILRQTAAPGAAVWVVQPSQLTASCQRPGFHRLRHQVHRAGQPRGLLGWLP